MTDPKGEAMQKELRLNPGTDIHKLCKNYAVSVRAWQVWKAAHQEVSDEHTARD